MRAPRRSKAESDENPRFIPTASESAPTKNGITNSAPAPLIEIRAVASSDRAPAVSVAAPTIERIEIRDPDAGEEKPGKIHHRRTTKPEHRKRGERDRPARRSACASPETAGRDGNRRSGPRPSPRNRDSSRSPPTVPATRRSMRENRRPNSRPTIRSKRRETSLPHSSQNALGKPVERVCAWAGAGESGNLAPPKK